MSFDEGFAVGRLVGFGFLALGGVAALANLNGAAVRVELLECFGGSQGAGLIEGLPAGWFVRSRRGTG